MLTGRALDNLGAEGEGLAALQTILNLFGEPYLTTQAANKPLSLLWARPDRLATVELYIFGKCLQKVLTSNEKWLKQTIREIKKSSEKARGLCTEIIYLGMFEVRGNSINPAPRNNAGYDFSITKAEGQNQYVSIKNIDISENNAAFQRGCRKLRGKWQEKLRLLKENLSLHAVFKNLPQEVDFDLAIKSIQGEKTIFPSMHLTPKDGIDIFVANLPPFAKISPAHTSDTVICYCTAPTSETNRYLSAIRNAAKNIHKHTQHDMAALRVLFMRLHANAEFEAIRQLAREIVNKEHSEVDCMIFHQPSYVRDENNNSLINHGFLMEANAKFGIYSATHGVVQCTPPIGSISLQQSRNQIRDLANGRILELSPSDYLFQQGDIYNLGEIGQHIPLNSPATGIREHGVCLVNGSYLTVSSKITPPTEELLLI